MSAEKKTLNIALIGLGMVAGTHLQAIADLKGVVQLKGVFARNTDSAVSFSTQAQALCGYPVVAYKAISDIVADPDLDFVIIATPPNARLELVQAFAAAGVHILLEKPIERTSDAASDIVELCESNNILLGVVFQHRARAASLKLAELVGKNIFGSLGLVEAVIPWWREQAYYNEPGRGTYSRDGGGVLISQAIHTLDLMLSLAGTVTEVQAMCRTTAFHNMESEDFVTAGLEFSNGAVGSVVASTASFPGNAESITLHFDKAVAVLNKGRLSIHWRDGRTEEYGETAATGGGADPMAFTSDWHRDIIDDFARAISLAGQPMASGREGLKVHRLIDAMVESSNTKRAVTLNQSIN